MANLICQNTVKPKFVFPTDAIEHTLNPNPKPRNSNSRPNSEKILKEILTIYSRENMGEGVRLRHNFNIEDKPNKQQLQPQRSQTKHVPENTFKDTETDNNIYIIL